MKNRESFPTHDRKTIEKWIDETLVRYQEESGSIVLPIDEKLLVMAMEDLMGVNIELEEQEEVFVHKNEGILMPKRGGFTLKYGLNSYRGKKKISNPVARRRFTICHELAHVFFYDCDQMIPKLTATPREDICHEIARKLLLPEEAVNKKFCEEYGPNANSVSFLRKFARDAKVSLYPVAIRLTEELSLLEDVMITFWRYRGDRSKPEIRYENFAVDSKTCPRLRKSLPQYWRRHIHIKAWEEAVREAAISGTALSKESLYIEGKKRKRGKIKRILFDITCETLIDSSDQKLLLRWMNPISVHDLISTERFCLRTLVEEK